MYLVTHRNPLWRVLSVFIVLILTLSLILSPSASYAQALNLPVPGTMVTPTPAYVPALLKGMTVYPDNPLKFDFIVDSGNWSDNPSSIDDQRSTNSDPLKKESKRLIKYFLASLTVPQDELWVNLSPQEKDRIVPDALGRTELGRDLLAQDYLLKQLTASLMYPEDDLGRKFWQKIYKQAYEKYGTTDIPVDTFNKVWIIPESATVYENGNTVYVVESKLKVMLEQDYLSSQKSVASSQEKNLTTDNWPLATQIVRELILPAIEKEVNEGQTFAPLRQIYNSLILAKWYKDTVKNSILSQVYVDQNKTAGITNDDPKMKEKIYAQYMAAYKKGVYNYIKDEYDPTTKEIVPRKYFSGGFEGKNVPINYAMMTTDKAMAVGDYSEIKVELDQQGGTKTLLRKFTRIFELPRFQPQNIDFLSAGKVFVATAVVLGLIIIPGCGPGKSPVSKNSSSLKPGIENTIKDHQIQNIRQSLNLPIVDALTEKRINRLTEFASGNEMNVHRPDIIELVKLKETSLPYLLYAASNSSGMIPAYSVMTLGEIGIVNHPVLNTLRELMNKQGSDDNSRLTRIKTAEAAAKLNVLTPQALNVLRHEIATAGEEISPKAVAALRFFDPKNPEVVQLLIQILERSRVKELKVAIDILGRFGYFAKDAIPELKTVQQTNQNSFIRYLTDEALKKIDIRKDLDFYKDYLNVSLELYQAMSIVKLGEMGPVALETSSQIQAALDSGNFYLRTVARRALEKINRDARQAQELTPQEVGVQTEATSAEDNHVHDLLLLLSRGTQAQKAESITELLRTGKPVLKPLVEFIKTNQNDFIKNADVIEKLLKELDIADEDFIADLLEVFLSNVIADDSRNFNDRLAELIVGIDVDPYIATTMLFDHAHQIMRFDIMDWTREAGHFSLEIKIALLKALVTDPDVHVRALAADILGDMGLDAVEAVPFLGLAIKSDFSKVQENQKLKTFRYADDIVLKLFAVKALGKIGIYEPNTFEAVKDLADSENYLLSRLAARTLPKMKTGIISFLQIADISDTQLIISHLKTLGIYNDEITEILVDRIHTMLLDETIKSEGYSYGYLQFGANSSSPGKELILTLVDKRIDLLDDIVDLLMEKADLTEDVLEAIVAASEVSPSAIKSIGKIDPEVAKEYVSLLGRYVRSDDPFTQMAAITALQNIGFDAKPAVPDLKTALSTPNPKVVALAAEAIAKIWPGVKDYKDVSVAFVDVLALPDEYDAQKAAEVVNLPYELLGKTEIFQDYTAEKLHTAKLISAYMIGKFGMGGIRTVGVLRSALKSKYQDVRMLSAQSLGRIGSVAKYATDDLEKIIKDPRESDEMQLVATIALYNIMGLPYALADKKIKLILPFLEEEDAPVAKKKLIKGRTGGLSKEKLRQKGKSIVSSDKKELSDEEIQQVIFNFDSYDLEERKSADALIKKAGDRATPYLIKALKEARNYQVRNFAVYRLGDLGKENPKEIVPVLIEALGEGGQIVPGGATSALTKIGVPAIPYLIKEFETGDEKTVQLIVHAFKGIGTDAVPFLVAAINQSQNDQVRTYAMFSLDSIGVKSFGKYGKDVRALCKKIMGNTIEVPYIRQKAEEFLKEIPQYSAEAETPRQEGQGKDVLNDMTEMQLAILNIQAQRMAMNIKPRGGDFKPVHAERVSQLDALEREIRFQWANDLYLAAKQKYREDFPDASMLSNEGSGVKLSRVPGAKMFYRFALQRPDLFPESTMKKAIENISGQQGVKNSDLELLKNLLRHPSLNIRSFAHEGIQTVFRKNFSTGAHLLIGEYINIIENAQNQSDVTFAYSRIREIVHALMQIPIKAPLNGLPEIYDTAVSELVRVHQSEWKLVDADKVSQALANMLKLGLKKNDFAPPTVYLDHFKEVLSDMRIRQEIVNDIVAQDPFEDITSLNLNDADMSLAVHAKEKFKNVKEGTLKTLFVLGRTLSVLSVEKPRELNKDTDIRTLNDWAEGRQGARSTEGKGLKDSAMTGEPLWKNKDLQKGFLSGIESGMNAFVLVGAEDLMPYELLFRRIEQEGFNYFYGPKMELTKEQAEVSIEEWTRQDSLESFMYMISESPVIPVFIVSDEEGAVKRLRDLLSDMSEQEEFEGLISDILSADSPENALIESKFILEHLNRDYAMRGEVVLTQSVENSKIDLTVLDELEEKLKDKAMTPEEFLILGPAVGIGIAGLIVLWQKISNASWIPETLSWARKNVIEMDNVWDDIVKAIKIIAKRSKDERGDIILLQRLIEQYDSYHKEDVLTASQLAIAQLEERISVREKQPFKGLLNDKAMGVMEASVVVAIVSILGIRAIIKKGLKEWRKKVLKQWKNALIENNMEVVIQAIQALGKNHNLDDSDYKNLQGILIQGYVNRDGQVTRIAKVAQMYLSREQIMEAHEIAINNGELYRNVSAHKKALEEIKNRSLIAQYPEDLITAQDVESYKQDIENAKEAFDIPEEERSIDREVAMDILFALRTFPDAHPRELIIKTLILLEQGKYQESFVYSILKGFNLISSDDGENNMILGDLYTYAEEFLEDKAMLGSSYAEGTLSWARRVLDPEKEGILWDEKERAIKVLSGQVWVSDDDYKRIEKMQDYIGPEEGPGQEKVRKAAKFALFKMEFLGLAEKRSPQSMLAKMKTIKHGTLYWARKVLRNYRDYKILPILEAVVIVGQLKEKKDLKFLKWVAGINPNVDTVLSNYLTADDFEEMKWLKEEKGIDTSDYAMISNPVLSMAKGLFKSIKGLKQGTDEWWTLVRENPKKHEKLIQEQVLKIIQKDKKKITRKEKLLLLNLIGINEDIDTLIIEKKLFEGKEIFGAYLRAVSISRALKGDLYPAKVLIDSKYEQFKNLKDMKKVYKALFVSTNEAGQKLSARFLSENDKIEALVRAILSSKDLKLVVEFLGRLLDFKNQNELLQQIRAVSKDFIPYMESILKRAEKYRKEKGLEKIEVKEEEFIIAKAYNILLALNKFSGAVVPSLVRDVFVSFFPGEKKKLLDAVLDKKSNFKFEKVRGSSAEILSLMMRLEREEGIKRDIPKDWKNRVIVTVTDRETNQKVGYGLGIASAEKYRIEGQTKKRQVFDELSIKVFPEYQGKGLEAALRKKLIEEAKNKFEYYAFMQGATNLTAEKLNQEIKDVYGQWKIVYPENFTGDMTIADPQILIFKLTPDSAMNASSRESLGEVSDPGGIDLNNIPVNRQGKGSAIEFKPQAIENVIIGPVEGFIPVIINITPIHNILPLLGLDANWEEETTQISMRENYALEPRAKMN